MKKIIVFLLLMISISYCSINDSFVNDIFNLNEIENVNIYINKDTEENIIDAIKIKNGNGFILQCEKETAKTLYSKLDNIDGISFEVINFDEKNLDNIKIMKTENIEKLKIIYGYNKNIKKFIKIDNYKINIQIALTSDKATIGIPIILGGY